jgi:Transposase DDE domain
MRYLTCVPGTVSQALFKYKHHFRCAQGRHFVLFCWIEVALILESGRGTLKDLVLLMPERVRYWAVLRLVRSGQWEASALFAEMVGDLILLLPPARDRALHLIGDTTLKRKRGKQHPLGHKTRFNGYQQFTFGFEVVLLLASWDHFRIPVAMAVIDPQIQGQQNELFRRMLREFRPPGWAQQVIVEADAGFAATKTFQALDQLGYAYVFAAARTRKFTNGKSLRDLVRHLPRSRYRRRKSSKPDGRRADYWVWSCQAQLRGVGDVTILLSKRRRNDGPKNTKIIVTNLKQVSAGTILSYYSRRWGVEVTFKEIKGGLHLGRQQVTKDPERVRRTVLLSGCAYLLLLRLYARGTTSSQEVSLFALKRRFTADVWQQQVDHVERKWKRKFEKLKAAA